MEWFCIMQLTVKPSFLRGFLIASGQICKKMKNKMPWGDLSQQSLDDPNTNAITTELSKEDWTLEMKVARNFSKSKTIRNIKMW